MEPVQIPSLGSNNAAARALFPQPVKADEILDNGHGSKQSGADTEDCIGGQLIASEAVPHAKVEANGHEDAVDNNQRPEPGNGLFPWLERVVEGRRPGEVWVVVGDLGVGKEGLWVWRCRPTWLSAGVEA